MFSLYPYYHESEGEGVGIAFLTVCPKGGGGKCLFRGGRLPECGHLFKEILYVYLSYSYSNLVLILGNKIYTKVHNFEKNTCKIKIISSLLLLLKSIDYKIALAGKFFWCVNSVICKGIELAGSISLQSKHYSIYN